MVRFSAHTYSRTKALLNDFAAALETAHHPIITEIYAAREKKHNRHFRQGFGG